MFPRFGIKNVHTGAAHPSANDTVGACCEVSYIHAACPHLFFSGLMAWGLAGVHVVWWTMVWVLRACPRWYIPSRCLHITKCAVHLITLPCVQHYCCQPADRQVLYKVSATLRVRGTAQSMESIVPLCLLVYMPDAGPGTEALQQGAAPVGGREWACGLWGQVLMDAARWVFGCTKGGRLHNGRPKNGYLVP